MAEPKKKEETSREMFEGLASDQIRDEAIQRSPQLAWKALTALEKAKLTLQSGAGKNKKAALALLKKVTPIGSKYLGRLSGPVAGTALEMGKAGMIMTDRSEGAFDKRAELGDELVEKPVAYQVGNAMINPSEAMSEYGARGEREDKEAFEDERSLQNEMFAKFEEDRQREMEVPYPDPEEGRNLAAAKAAFEDEDLESMTMQLVRNITRGE